MAAPPGPAPAPAPAPGPAPGPADEIRGLHLLYVKEVAAAASSSLAASPAAGGAAAAAGGAAAPGAPAPAGGAADLPELYVGKDNKLYGIDGTQLVRINVDAGNLVRVADAAAHSEKKDGDEELITEKGYKSAETAAVRHARKALATLESRFPIIKNIADLRKRLEECCSGIAPAPGAVAASAGAAPPGAPAAGAVDVIKLLTDDINNNILRNISNLYQKTKKALLEIYDMIQDLKDGNDVDIENVKDVFDAMDTFIRYLNQCSGKLEIGYKIANGKKDFTDLIEKAEKSIQLGNVFIDACSKFMDIINAMLNENDYHYFYALEPQFSAAMDLHDVYIKNNYEDNAALKDDDVVAAYTSIKYLEEEENSNNGSRSVRNAGTEEGNEESSNNESGTPVGAAEPNLRKPQSGGARNRRVTPIGKKIGGISIKKRTPKKKSRSKK